MFAFKVNHHLQKDVKTSESYGIYFYCFCVPDINTNIMSKEKIKKHAIANQKLTFSYYMLYFLIHEL